MSNCAHPTNEPCNLDCTPVCIEQPCCDPVRALPTPICDMVVSTICCEAQNISIFDRPDDVNGQNNCPCAPCPGDLGFTVEQKAFITKTFKSLIDTLIPAPVCGCEIQPTTGHLFSIQGKAVPRLNANGQPTGLFDSAGNCCGPSYKDNPFMNSGGYRNRHLFKGGRPTPIYDLDMGTSTRGGMDAILKVICCTRDSILSGPDIAITPVGP
jgi:hypothetical protein